MQPFSNDGAISNSMAPVRYFRRVQVENVDYLLAVAAALGLSPVTVQAEIKQHGALVVAGLLAAIASNETHSAVVH